MRKKYYMLILITAFFITGCQNQNEEIIKIVEPEIVKSIEIESTDNLVEKSKVEDLEQVEVEVEVEDLDFDKIKQFQNKLIALNYELKADGLIGNELKNTLIEFQKDFELVEQNGQLDKNTRDKIQEIYNERLVQDPNSELVLVNKTYFLDSKYEPKNLVVPNVPFCIGEMKLQEVAAMALEEMFEAAKTEANYSLIARSGYRSYNTQVQLFDRYVKNNGYSEAVKFSAKPGQSEHQTGLAMDITADSVNRLLKYAFGETEEGIWTKENCHRFGFIIRYPKDKTDITRYNYEPWHLRYVGEVVADEIYNKQISLEEYFGKID